MTASSRASSPLVSVVMPVYNGMPFLPEALESVRKQSYRNLEIIIVDDGSTDSTADYLMALNDSRLRILRQPNKGQCAALNCGITNATGDYIKFVDHDDLINANHIEAQLNAIGSCSDVVASCRWGYFRGNPDASWFPDEVTHRNYDEPMDFLVDSLTRDHQMLGGWMWLIPKSMLATAGGWDERLSFDNDYEFSTRLLLASDGVRFASDAKFFYRKGVQSSMTQGFDRSAMESAYLAGMQATERILAYENSERTRRMCADRLQKRLFQFYPEYPELAREIERRISELGGSKLVLQGGPVLRFLRGFMPWKMIRRLQVTAHRLGG